MSSGPLWLSLTILGLASIGIASNLACFFILTLKKRSSMFHNLLKVSDILYSVFWKHGHSLQLEATPKVHRRFDIVFVINIAECKHTVQTGVYYPRRLMPASGNSRIAGAITIRIFFSIFYQSKYNRNNNNLSSDQIFTLKGKELYPKPIGYLFVTHEPKVPVSSIKLQ